jgi:hypothetical protein
MIKFLVLLLFILFVWSFFIEPNLLTITRYKVDNLDGKKIVFVSDFHIAKWDKRRLKRIVNEINKLNPDLVLSGGDFIKGHTGKRTLSVEEQAEELSKIKAPMITVLGNHDAWYDKYTVKTALERQGITVLHNTGTKVGNLYISGVEDMQTSVPEIEAALENTEFPRILLSHTPDIYYDVKEDVDLILAGHVHGGQVRLPFIGALICPSTYGTKFASGDFKETQNRMIVTRGLGTSILSMRFNDIPEIVVLEENNKI